MIASLEDSRVRSEKDAEETHVILLETENLKRELEEKLNDFETKKNNLEMKAKEQARKIVENAKRESEAVISELRALQLNAGTPIKEHELIEARKRLEGAAPEQEKEKQIRAKEGPRPLAVGDEVKVLSYGQKGTLLDKVSATEWIVQIGILKMKLDESGLQCKPEKEKQTYISTSVTGEIPKLSLSLTYAVSVTKTHCIVQKNISTMRFFQIIIKCPSFTEKEQAL